VLFVLHFAMKSRANIAVRKPGRANLVCGILNFFLDFCLTRYLLVFRIQGPVLYAKCDCFHAISVAISFRKFESAATIKISLQSVETSIDHKFRYPASAIFEGKTLFG